MEKIFGIVHMDIEPGKAEVFRTAALTCIEAAKADLGTTGAYEWFLAEDGLSCTVIEVYDDVDAIAQHSKQVGALLAPVKDVASFHVLFAGDVPEAIIERMRSRLGAVDMFGPRFQGLLQERSEGIVGRDAGTMIFAVARFAIHPGKETEFRALAEECFARVQANEPDTIGYEWFLSPDGRNCLTLDVYRNVAALGAHMANAGPVMGKILTMVDSDTRLYGALPDAMRSKFKPELGVRFIAPQLGGVM